MYRSNINRSPKAYLLSLGVQFCHRCGSKYEDY